jgi:hypothetical protein
LSLFNTYEKRIAHIFIVIIFLALIRCLFEFYRLEYLLKENLTVTIIKPFILGALIASISALVMIILYFLSNYKSVPFVGIVAIVLLLIVKVIYNVN